jgi:hypothetical protein
VTNMQQMFQSSGMVIDYRAPPGPWDVASINTVNMYTRVCTRPSDVTGYALAESNLDLSAGVFDVSADCCAAGCEGTAAVGACTTDGDYTLSGCSAIICARPSNPGYTVTETNLDLTVGAFDVTAECADGYHGSATVTGCTTTAPYTLSGCMPTVCSMPSRLDKVGYTVWEVQLALQIPGEVPFTVSAACTPGYTVSDVDTVDAQDSCTSTQLTGNTITASDTTRCTLTSTVDFGATPGSCAAVDPASATCEYIAGAYSRSGVGTVTPCTAHGAPYTLSGCKVVCTRPADLTGYLVTELQLDKSIGFDVTTTCAPNYKGPAAVRACTSSTPYILSGCEPIICTRPEVLPRGYRLPTETSLNLAAGPVCIDPADAPEPPVGDACAADLVLLDAGVVSHTDLENNQDCSWVLTCSDVSLTPHLSFTEFHTEGNSDFVYTYDGTDASAGADGRTNTLHGNISPDTIVGGGPSMTVQYVSDGAVIPDGFAATFTCCDDGGFDVSFPSIDGCATNYGGTPEATACLTPGRAYTLSGCSPIVCTRPTDVTGYYAKDYELARAEGTARTALTVVAECVRGYYGTAVVTPCSVSAEPYTLSGCNAIRCSTPEDLTGYTVTSEVELSVPSFAVSAVCAENYDGVATVSAASCSGECGGLITARPECACGDPVAAGHDGCCNYGQGTCLDLCASGGMRDGSAVSCWAHDQCGCTGCRCNTGTAPYTLSGCYPIVCSTPRNSRGYEAPTETNLDLSLGPLDVSSACATSDMYEGTAIATACTSDGAPYVLSGCKPIVCTSPGILGYVVEREYQLDLSIGDLDVSVTCATSFTGVATAAPCAASGPYLLGGCAPKLCVRPSTAEDTDLQLITVAGYTGVLQSWMTMMGVAQLLGAVTCAPGYSGTPDVQCEEAGQEFIFRGCAESKCAAVSLLALGSGVIGGYRDACAEGMRLAALSDPSCAVRCDDGYSPFALSPAVTCPVHTRTVVQLSGVTGSISFAHTYADRTTSSWTITCPNAQQTPTLVFSSFNTEAVDDYVNVYAGSITAAAAAAGAAGLVAPMSGPSLPVPNSISSPQQAMTVVFTSDGSVTAPGFAADYTCRSHPTTAPSSATSPLRPPPPPPPPPPAVDYYPTTGGQLGCVEHTCAPIVLGPNVVTGDSDGCVQGQQLSTHTDASCTVKCADGFAPQGLVHVGVDDVGAGGSSTSPPSAQEWTDARHSPTPIRCLATSEQGAPTVGGVICRRILGGACQPGSCDCHGVANDPSLSCDVDAATDGTAECPDGCTSDATGYMHACVDLPPGGHTCNYLCGCSAGGADPRGRFLRREDMSLLPVDDPTAGPEATFYAHAGGCAAHVADSCP